MEEKKHSRIDVWGKGVSLLRETVLILLLLLLLIWPSGINSILSSAGFTEASIAGMTWEKLEESTDDTEDALQTIEQLKVQLESVRTQLAEVLASAPDPAVRRSVDSALADVEAMQDSTVVMKRSLKESHANAQYLLQQFRPTREMQQFSRETK